MSATVVDKSTGEVIEQAVILSDEPVNKASGQNRARENADFVMLYRRFIAQIADLGADNTTALRVLLFLIKHMDGTNALGVPQKLMSEMMGISRQTVNGAIKYLEQHGWIQVYKLGKSNVYVVNPDVVWTSYADQRAYCKFQGTFLLSSEDNWAIRSQDRTQVKYLDPLTARQMADAEFPDAPQSKDGITGQLTLQHDGTVKQGGRQGNEVI